MWDKLARPKESTCTRTRTGLVPPHLTSPIAIGFYLWSLGFIFVTMCALFVLTWRVETVAEETVTSFKQYYFITVPKLAPMVAVSISIGWV